MRIDLGCGSPQAKHEGCIGVDWWKGNKPDICADIRERIEPLDDSCASEIHCWHVLEHLPNENDWRKVFREISRLLRDCGVFKIAVPHPAHEDAMIHGHIDVFTPRFWRDVQSGYNVIDVPLVIDEVYERPNPEAVAYCETMGANFDSWCKYHRNAFIETIVSGHKEVEICA